MQAPTGTASNFCGAVFTTDGVTNAISAPGRWAFETVSVCGRTSSTMVLISGRLSHSYRGTGRLGRPDSALPGPADQTFFVGSRNLRYLSEAMRHKAGCLRLDQPGLRGLFPL